MYAPAANAAPPARAQTATPDDNVRREVASLLTRSDAFNRMSDADKRDIAHNTALVADYLARPEGMALAPPATAPTGAPAEGMFLFGGENKAAKEASWADRKAAVDAIGEDKFEATSAREGARVAGMLLNEVRFPKFVSELINGVFMSITKSSIEQMEAYQEMIASVATSLRKFMDDNVSPNQGRDNMVDQFPDLFEIGMDDWGESGEPKLKLREGVDENEALKRVNNKLEFEAGAIKSLDLSDGNVEKVLIENSRMQLARQRQQLLASIVLMGINRIVVTDGRISAKIMYDVRSDDRYAKRRSATAMDVARDAFGRVQTTRAGEETIDKGGSINRSNSGGDRDYSADYFAKGEHKYEDKAIITASTSASEQSTAALQTKIQLTGAVDVNFKSDYLPLDKMATPQMIAAIQGNATPADPNVVPSPKNPSAAGATSSPPAPTAGTIAPAPAA